ncbi:tRNA 2-selenouridine(34) synthase MnmH [Tumebacillus lipolyticus]|uniref:tRNA 2-selenouridine(34) synthase MnmH n=1 Tax=Tumebacillus lipolyticus TaxID=1280370 RepID=A0ABW5A0X7_9BACL
MAFQEISVDRLHEAAGRVLIDVRSPKEFHEGTIPGSVNVPLFTDEERAMIGTVYKQQSPAAARRLAMLTVSPKIPQIVEQMEALMDRGELVIFCWRGGMRSYAACTFMSLLKYPIVRLKGGYRAYRQLVMNELSEYAGIKSRVIVLHGNTGVGKTRLLAMLKESGHQVLDLERMANHRGSVFGRIGLGEAHNQKTFDAMLWEELRALEHARPVFLEAESKRIGRAVLPDWLEADKRNGYHVLIEAPLQERVARLVEDYVLGDEDKMIEQFREALSSIKRRVSRDQSDLFEELLEAKQYEQLCAQLLQNYYDPKYEHKLRTYRTEMLKIDAVDLLQAVGRLERLADELGTINAADALTVSEGV